MSIAVLQSRWKLFENALETFCGDDPVDVGVVDVGVAEGDGVAGEVAEDGA